MDKRRRVLLLSLSGILGFGSSRPAMATETSPLLIGITPVILDDQRAFLQKWQSYLEAQLAFPVRFVQRNSYREIMKLLTEAKIDYAWLCGFPFVRMKEQLTLVAVPCYRGAPLYQALLLVPATDSETRSILDLAGRVFAYADPDSNSGWLVPQVELKRAGRDPTLFFKKSFFAWSHRHVVKSVASGLAHGGAVDSYIWETMAEIEPALTAATRVAWQSPPYGFPPIVARPSAPLLDRMRQVLLTMHEQGAGKALLDRLHIDGFIPGDPHLYAPIEAKWHFLEQK